MINLVRKQEPSPAQPGIRGGAGGGGPRERTNRRLGRGAAGEASGEASGGRGARARLHPKLLTLPTRRLLGAASSSFPPNCQAAEETRPGDSGLRVAPRPGAGPPAPPPQPDAPGPRAAGPTWPAAPEALPRSPTPTTPGRPGQGRPPPRPTDLGAALPHRPRGASGSAFGAASRPRGADSSSRGPPQALLRARTCPTGADARVKRRRPPRTPEAGCPGPQALTRGRLQGTAAALEEQGARIPEPRGTGARNTGPPPQGKPGRRPGGGEQVRAQAPRAARAQCASVPPSD
uniref:proline-rich protein 2-like n=1 Tax=Nyctereutes procyonoides TaxID=34880 RepID=UPI0024438A2E|nr:proline-rich protein 2-like [Nyctereutes procyonoides]